MDLWITRGVSKETDVLINFNTKTGEWENKSTFLKKYDEELRNEMNEILKRLDAAAAKTMTPPIW